MEKALIDANVLVGLYRSDDSAHRAAIEMVSEIKRGETKIVILNLVMHEIATVLSMRVGMDLARKFLKDYKNIVDMEIFMDEDLEKQAWEIFTQQKKRGTSFVDCANLAVIQKYKLDGILTFDEFYPKELRLAKVF